jgi:two-component system OmpR family sensor kinase
MVAAVVSHGKAVDAGYLTSSGARAALTPTAQAQLERIAGSRKPVTLDLKGLGRYRVIAAPSRSGGDVIVTGLSMSNVDATMIRMLIILGIVTVIALIAATSAGVVIIRRALAPLRRVAATASEVVDLPLDRGEVELPVRVAESDANPSTEVGQLGSALNRMLDHIAAALSTRQASETRVRQFVADASHELRTPLASLRANIQVLQDAGRLSDNDRENLRRDVIEELDELTALVADVVELARGSRAEAASDDVRVDQIVEQAVERTRRRGDVRVEAKLEPTIVRGEPDRVSRAVSNLLENARKWSPPGGLIEVSLEEGVLTVRDHGPGFQAEDLPKVFERFYRADQARKLPGSGLGLAIVRQAAEAHDGYARAANAPGGGALLEVSFGPHP